MNNVWTAMVLRAPCAFARPARSKPLLQLFNGYARQQCPRTYAHSPSRSDSASSANATKWMSASAKCSTREVSSSAPLSARRKPQAIPVSSAQKSPTVPRPEPVSLTKPVSRAEPPSALKKAPVPQREPSSRARPQSRPTAATQPKSAPRPPLQRRTNTAQALTWRDYDPEGGMPLPDGELSPKGIEAVFDGQAVDVDVDTGNYILHVLHWRRMSGALIDTGLAFPKDRGVSHAQAVKALEYIREILPNVDESANAQLWADEEAERIQVDLQERAVKLGIYKEAPEEEQEQGTEYGRERSGHSALEAHRAEQEVQWEEFQAKKKADAERAEQAAVRSARGPLELGGGIQPPVRVLQTTTASLPTQHAERRQEIREQVAAEAELIQEQSYVFDGTPELSAVQRLVPSLVCAFVVLLGSALYSVTYAPPPASARILPELPASVATLLSLTAAMILGFIAGRVPPLWKYVNRYLTVVPLYPHPLSMLGAAFRHDTFKHLLSNVVSLWLFGWYLHNDVGRGTFLAIFASSAVLGSFASLSLAVARQTWKWYMFGASSGVAGVVAAQVVLHPNASFTVAGYEVPIALWVVFGLWAAGEAAGAALGHTLKTTVDHMGHLGGMVAGLVSAAVLRWGRKADKGVGSEEDGKKDKDGVVMERVVAADVRASE